MSLVLKKTGLLCCVLLVASEHVRWLGGDFHTVNHVYFSAEKVQFALHLFPKTDHFVLWPGHFDRPITHNNQEQRRPFSSFSIYCKEVFSYTTKTVIFNLLFPLY